MKKTGIALMLSCAALGSALLSPFAAAHHKKNLPPCEPGYEWVEVTEYKEVCKDVCKIVPDVKKTTKWVYSTIDDPFCIHKSGHHHGHHDCEPGCPTCKGPYHRKQLVKRQEVCEEPTTKCVVEKIVEQVPCTVWRKVPCGPSFAAPSAPHAPAATTPAAPPARKNP